MFSLNFFILFFMKHINSIIFKAGIVSKSRMISMLCMGKDWFATTILQIWFTLFFFQISRGNTIDFVVWTVASGLARSYKVILKIQDNCFTYQEGKVTFVNCGIFWSLSSINCNLDFFFTYINSIRLRYKELKFIYLVQKLWLLLLHFITSFQFYLISFLNDYRLFER